MNQVRRQQISDYAHQVCQTLNLNPPVDVYQAVGYLGGQVETLDPSIANGAEAYVRKNSSGFAIGVDDGPRQNKRRLRFTIAHEIGHLLLHMGYLQNDGRWDVSGNYVDSVRYRKGYSEEEYEAHEFAASFLMPKKDFILMINMLKRGGSVDINALADHFEVSIEAARNRGKWLGLFAW